MGIWGRLENGTCALGDGVENIAYAPDHCGFVIWEGAAPFEKGEAGAFFAAWDAEGARLCARLRGTYALAVYRRGVLTLARDRFGQKPLYYARTGAGYVFASELRAVRAEAGAGELDARFLRDVATAWAGLGEHTLYAGVSIVECGSSVTIREGAASAQRFAYCAIRPRSDAQEAGYRPGEAPDTALVDALESRLREAIRRRLQPEKDVAFTLSGGVDSSLVCAMATRELGAPIRSYSVGFADAAYDESDMQARVAEFLGCRHTRIEFRAEEAAARFREAVHIVQSPLLRFSPAPMLALARAVRGARYVLTGEGADELFGGYDLYKEVLVREFCRRDAASTKRPLLYTRLYPYVEGFGAQNSAALAAFFAAEGAAFPSHANRFAFGAYCQQFFSDAVRAALSEYDFEAVLRRQLSPDFARFTPLAQAQAIEVETFHNNHLILQQGYSIFHSAGLELRVPFLDDAVAAFAFGLEDRHKIQGLQEKALVKRVAERYLPREFVYRRKFPFRAPVPHRALLEDPALAACVTSEAFDAAGLFRREAALRFLARAGQKERLTEKESMLFLLLLSTQLLAREGDR